MDARKKEILDRLLTDLSEAMAELEEQWARGEGSREDAPEWYEDARDLFAWASEELPA